MENFRQIASFGLVSKGALAVEMEVGHAQRGPVEGGLPDRTGKSEGLSQIRARLPARGFPSAISNPLGCLERYRFLDSRRRAAGNPHLVPKIRTKMTRGSD